MLIYVSPESSHFASSVHTSLLSKVEFTFSCADISFEHFSIKSSIGRASGQVWDHIHQTHDWKFDEAERCSCTGLEAS